MRGNRVRREACTGLVRVLQAVRHCGPSNRVPHRVLTGKPLILKHEAGLAQRMLETGCDGRVCPRRRTEGR